MKPSSKRVIAMLHQEVCLREADRRWLEMRRSSETHKLDLHGLRHEAVRNPLIRVIEDLWGTDTRLDIITGHSPKMKQIVIQVLSEYKLDFVEGDTVNKGYLKTTIP